APTLRRARGRAGALLSIRTSRSPDRFLEIETQWIDAVLPERRPSHEAVAFVETDRLLLMNPRLQAQNADPPAPGVVRHVIEHPPTQAPSAEGRAHEHPLDLAVPVAEQLQAAAPRGRVQVPRHEEGHPFTHELLDAVRVPALRRVEVAVEMR